MHKKKAELKETQKYHYWDVNFKCSYTKNPWNEKYVRIIQNNSKTFELRLAIKKRSGYYILAHKCIVLLEIKTLTCQKTIQITVIEINFQLNA